MTNYYTKLRLWIFCGIIATFVLGFVSGLILCRAITLKTCRHQSTQNYIDKVSKFLSEDKSLNRIIRKLDLTRSQIQTIGGILRIQSLNMKLAQEEFKSKIGLIIQDTQRIIKKHLNPEQAEKYNKLTGTQRNKWEKLLHKD